MSKQADARLVGRDYHLKRANDAQAMAAASRGPAAKRLHQAMAKEYLLRADDGPGAAGLKQVRE